MQKDREVRYDTIQLNMKNKKILIVDDAADLRDILRDKLTQEGYTTLTAENGKIGLETAFKEHPDLILLDIVMPEMDGWGMLTELKNDPWGKTVPVIMLTNLDDMTSVSQAVEKGTYEYIVKANFELDEIVKMIEKKV